MSASNGLKFMPAWMFLTIHLASPVRTKCHWSKTSGPKWMKILRIIFMHRTGTKRYHRLAIPWQNSDGSDRGVKGRYSYGTWNHFVPQSIYSYIYKYKYKYNIYLRMGPSVATYFALFFFSRAQLSYVSRRRGVLSYLTTLFCPVGWVRYIYRCITSFFRVPPSILLFFFHGVSGSDCSNASASSSGVCVCVIWCSRIVSGRKLVTIQTIDEPSRKQIVLFHQSINHGITIASTSATTTTLRSGRSECIIQQWSGCSRWSSTNILFIVIVEQQYQS